MAEVLHIVTNIEWVRDLSVVSSVLGLFVSLVGFAFTYVRAARAADAAHNAFEAVKARNSIGDLSDAYARLQQIRAFVKDGNMSAASAVFDNVYRNMAHIISVLDERDDVNDDEVQKARRYLDQLKQGLEEPSDTNEQTARHISQQLRIVERFVVENDAKLKATEPRRR